MTINKYFKITTLSIFILVAAGQLIALSMAAEKSPKEPVKEIVIIVNPSAKLKDVKLKDLKRIYECKMKTLKGVGKLALVNLPKKDPSRIAFSKMVLKKTAEEMERLYLKNALSGKGQPPKTVKTEKELLEYVRNNKQAMAYVRSGIKLDGVKIITVDKKKTIKEIKESKK